MRRPAIVLALIGIVVIAHPGRADPGVVEVVVGKTIERPCGSVQRRTLPGVLPSTATRVTVQMTP
jgi:hypothetical protein